MAATKVWSIAIMAAMYICTCSIILSATVSGCCVGVMVWQHCWQETKSEPLKYMPKFLQSL